MRHLRVVALVVVAASAVAATFACITGSPSANVSCTQSQSDPQSCLCMEGTHSDTACPGANAAPDTVCCAEMYYPSIGNCSCTRAPTGCAFDPSGCSCGIVAVDAATVPSCNPATQWASCCKSASGCTCTLTPNAACTGTVVASCSSSDADGGTCSVGTGDCTCSPSSQFGAATCGTPQVTCCLDMATYNPGFSSCTCRIGPPCQGGQQQVSSCSASMVADAALHDYCANRQLGGTIVKSCNPPDGG